MKISLIAYLLLFAFITNAQVGIGTTTPASSSALEIKSDSTGLLPPRLSKAAKEAMVNPVAGLMIWCIDCGLNGQMQVYNGNEWTNMLGGLRADITLGSAYGGGIVAYVLQPGDPGYVATEIHGLIAATVDQSTGVRWGCAHTGLAGTMGIVLGTGQANTTAIVNGCVEPVFAARICNDLVLNGYDDWYLPSKDELNKLYLNKSMIGGFTNFRYWSSTQNTSPSTDAWTQRFDNGTQLSTDKNITCYARAIRAF